MSLTPNFGMNIPDSTDIVNLLTQCYPNFTLLDTALQTIKESGTTVATETKVGTAHQLVRVVPDCSVIRFVATSNYATGDTFTVDGNPVTATAPDGTSLPTGAYVINMNVLAILTGTQLTVFAGEAHTAAGTSFDNTGTNYSSTNVEDALKEVGPRGSVSVTSDGTKTWGDILADFYSLIDMAKVTTQSLILDASSGNIYRIGYKSNTALVYIYEELTLTYDETRSLLIQNGAHSARRLSVTSGTNSFSDITSSVVSAGRTLVLYY